MKMISENVLNYVLKLPTFMKYLLRSIVFSFVFVALIGAGCSRSSVSRSTEVTGPTVAVFEGLTPQQATEKIHFVPGSLIEIRQTFLGLGAQLAAALAGDDKEGVRTVHVDRFAPLETADVTWKIVKKEETNESQKARAEAAKKKQKIPEPVLEDRVTEGGVQGFNLKDAHSLYVPAFWPGVLQSSSLGTSGIWLSDEVYQALARNRLATLTFGILDSSLQGAIGKVTQFKNAFAALQGQAAAIENRIDVAKLDGEKDVAEWPLKVNGKNVTVEVLKAHNWFGEIVVLNNAQNPLVLKVTLNPLAASFGQNAAGIATLKSLLGYEVVELNGVQE
jgi:pimeloyl-ACP methyl ester carboxylesterase